MNPSPDICNRFAEAVAATRYEDLSPAAVAAARKSLLDTLGVMLAASAMEEGMRPIIELAREYGGRPESTVVGFGDRLPAASAALVNGALAHCLDFDDRTAWGAHAGSSLIPAALALAERQGKVSGRRFLAAIAAAQDIFVRLRLNLGRHQDWNLSTVLGTFSATAGAASILGLDAARIAHAMGIASLQPGGSMRLIYGGKTLRGMYAGFAAQTAVNAALLAHKGLTGVDDLFEGKAGLFEVYFEGKYQREEMLAGLGTDRLGADMLYKPWPAVGISHTYIHATIALMKEQRLRPADIAQIRVFVGAYQHEMCNPVDRRRRPTTAPDGKFSLPFCVALAAARGNVGISDFAPERLGDADVLAMADKVLPVPDAAADWTSKSPIGRIQVVTVDGREFERTGDRIPGSPEAPLSWDDLVRKFRDCAAATSPALTPAKVDGAVQMIAELESLDDVSPLAGLLV